MLKWYEKLETDASVKDPKSIKKKLDRGRRVPGIYLITLSSGPSNLLDIVPEFMLTQDRVCRNLPLIVGLAYGKGQALELACRLVVQLYEQTGDFRIRPYYMKKD